LFWFQTVASWRRRPWPWLVSSKAGRCRQFFDGLVQLVHLLAQLRLRFDQRKPSFVSSSGAAVVLARKFLLTLAQLASQPGRPLDVRVVNALGFFKRSSSACRPCTIDRWLTMPRRNACFEFRGRASELAVQVASLDDAQAFAALAPTGPPTG